MAEYTDSSAPVWRTPSRPLQDGVVTQPIFEESSPAEVEGARKLMSHFIRLDTAESRHDVFAVRPGTLLEGDDRATAYNPVSYQVQFLFMGAFDHIAMLRRALADHGMPPVAAYPLVRAALESAAQALWLTSGGTRKKRVSRALHRIWDGASLSDQALGHLYPQRTSSLGELRKLLDQLLAAAKVGQLSLDKNHPSMTDIVIDAGRQIGGRQFKPIDVWRLCSSMAHGNSTVSQILLDRRPHGPTTDFGGTFKVRTSYELMAVFIGVVTDVVEAALDDRDRLNV